MSSLYSASASVCDFLWMSHGGLLPTPMERARQRDASHCSPSEIWVSPFHSPFSGSQVLASDPAQPFKPTTLQQPLSNWQPFCTDFAFFSCNWGFSFLSFKLKLYILFVCLFVRWVGAFAYHPESPGDYSRRKYHIGSDHWVTRTGASQSGRWNSFLQNVSHEIDF